MSETIFGVLGAMGGALATSAAAYWGPIQMQRRAFGEQRRQADIARRDAEAASEEARRQADIARTDAETASEEARRQAEHERAVAASLRQQEREEAASALAQARREAETTRIILVRATMRAWSDLLARAIQDLGLGRPVDIERYDEAVRTTRSEAQSALDHVLHDGLWIRQSGYGYPAPSVLQPAYSSGQLRVLDALGRVTELTREAVIKGERLEAEQSVTLSRALKAADEARGALSAALLDRLQQDRGVSVLGAPASMPPWAHPPWPPAPPHTDIQLPFGGPATQPTGGNDGSLYSWDSTPPAWYQAPTGAEQEVVNPDTSS
jgi:hypothetical protein